MGDESKDRVRGDSGESASRPDPVPETPKPATPATPSAGPPLAPQTAAPEAVSRRVALLRRLAAARKLWRAEVVFLAALAAFAVLALYAKANAYFAWDKATARAIQGIDLPGMQEFMRVVSLFGDSWRSWAMVGLAMLLFLLLRLRTEMFGLLVSTAGGSSINRLFKYVIARPRPTLENVRVSGEWAHESFPSGHVTFYVCFFGFLFFAAFALLPKGSPARRAACALAALPVLLVGLSRVYLGAHWPSDTLGAYLLSGAWLAFTIHLYGRWKARSTFHQQQAEAAGMKTAE